ncbi:ABC transporter permease [Levilactobacillus bambusae]|uniref:Spermidine/putrescine ABC transporter permease PotC n=1 Tax=Levilactobacillus bambusae TaxID=2024736 RepID=A0A2V1N1A2_9LACO|nr:ABC transporter permease [Levilactobacillus bambusae]PWG00090.1 spermidine/putrescine ABC transporter permease PotC [Levilactobacillus bambusae]
MKKHRFSWSHLYLVLVFAVLYAPILFLIVYSFSQGNSMDHFHGFTLQHYQELFDDRRMIVIVINTMLIALLSALISTLIGTLGALQIDKTTNKLTRGTILSLNNILMVSPDVIIGASFLIFFTRFHIGLGFWTVLLSHIAFEIPIVVLMVLPRLSEMSGTMLDAAEDLGATNWQMLSRVILPFISPGIFAGFFMALTYSLDDFAVTFFVTGNGFSTLSVEIYSRARQGISLEINALSGLMFIFALGLIVGYYFIQQANQHRLQKHQKSGAV